MRFESFLAVILATISTCTASPTNAAVSRRAATPNQTGTNNGFYYVFWTDGQTPSATYTNGPGGSYSLSWSDGKGDLFGGKGWEHGTPTRVANYSGTFNPVGNSYLSLYGWTKNIYTEYRVIESYGTYNPTNASPVRATITCNGANYDVVRTIRYPQGFEPTLYQYYSIRNPKLPYGQVSGTIDFACHVAGWAGAGMNLGTDFDYQIISTEGYFSSGSGSITVS